MHSEKPRRAELSLHASILAILSCAYSDVQAPPFNHMLERNWDRTELGSYGEPWHCHSHSRVTSHKRPLPGHPGLHSEHWLEEFYPVGSRKDGPRSTVNFRRSMIIQTFLHAVTSILALTQASRDLHI